LDVCKFIMVCAQRSLRRIKVKSSNKSSQREKGHQTLQKTCKKRAFLKKPDKGDVVVCTTLRIIKVLREERRK